MSNKIMKGILVFLLIIAIIFTVSIIGIKKYKEFEAYKENLPSTEKADIESLYEGLEKDYTYVLLNDEIIRLEAYPVIQEGVIYLPLSFVIEKLNDNFYYDQEEAVLTYTTKEDVIRMQTDDLTYYVNSEPLTLNMPITELENGDLYMPHSLLLKFSQYDFSYNEKLDMLMIDDPERNIRFGIIAADQVALRTETSDKTPYIKYLASGEKVRIIEEKETWYKVRTEDGIFGYVLKENVQGITLEYGRRKSYESQKYNSNKSFEGKINLGWQQVYSQSSNQNIENVMDGVHGLNVLSPTWFEIIDSEGTVNNLASADYVEWAHNRDIEVWALFKCFDYDVSHEVLSSTAKREKVIKQILAFSSIYNVDGINIDFETIRKEDGIHFVQFIKEITPYLQSQGLVVSVDMYVPSAWTAHYNRTEVGQVVDYVMVMAYDEHWSTSPESGSVASIGFVEKGIVDTLKEVDNEKIVLGIPFYTRLWEEEVVDGKAKVKSYAYGMDRGYNTLVSNGADIVWSEEVKQYYGEYEKNGKIYKMWLEEERSMEEKVKFVEKYDLAGTAGWQLTLEKDEIWDVLEKYLAE